MAYVTGLRQPHHRAAGDPVSFKKHAARHRRQAGRHRKRAARNTTTTARNGILVAAVGLGLAVSVGNGIAAASTDGASSDSNSASQSAGNSGGNASHSAKSSRAAGTAGPARTRAASKPSAPASNGGSALVVRSPATGRAVPAGGNKAGTVTAPEPEPESSTETTGSTPDPVSEPAAPAATVAPASVKSTAAKAVPAAAAVPTAAAAPAPGTGPWYFMGALTRAINRLAGWPGPPRNFIEITNRQTDLALDAANNQLDALIANAVANSPARWIPDLLSITGLFVKSAIPAYSFTDSLNAMGAFLNRIVPPFTIASGADTFAVITPYKVMGAAVVGTASVLKDMLNGIYDPTTIVIHLIKATVGADVTASDLRDFNSLTAKVVAAQTAAMLGLGDGGAFHEPERAWNITLPTWTAAQVNPFTIATYIVTVAMYKRFQEIAVLQTFNTWTTYESWLYTISVLGASGTYSQYAAGSFHAVDDLGRAVDFGTSLLGTFTSAGGALVTINTAGGGYTYTNTLPGTAFFHKSTSENEADRYDTVNIPVTSADGVEYTLTFKIQILPGDGANHAPTGSYTAGAPDGLGVVRGKVTGSDSDGDTLRYSLVGSSVNGLSGNTAYTKNGGGNGGVVTLNPTTGDFTYVSSANAPATQSFQVQINDGHYGNTVVTVTVTNATSITPANVNTSTQNVVTGSVPVPTGDAGIFTSFAQGTAPSKGSLTSFNPTTGAFTYERNGTLGHSTSPGDVVTLIATTADGRTVTLRLNVTPQVPNAVPVIQSSTTDVGNASSARWGLNTSTWTQTTTGKITVTDADNDTLTYSLVHPTTHAPVATTTNGGTVTFNADGSYTYTNDKPDKTYFHNAARIGASGAAVSDTFTIAVSDGFGGVVYQNVSIAIYAVNANPSLSLGSLVCAFGACTITITTTDPDGDDLSGGLNTSNNGTGSPWYTLERGSVTINAGNQHTMSWTGNSDGLGTQQTGDQRYTVYDGYYRVNNGIVDTGYFTNAWVDWHDTTRTTGN